jgi:hypothetical protein
MNLILVKTQPPLTEMQDGDLQGKGAVFPGLNQAPRYEDV